MKIEFASIGSGINIQVSLLEMIGETEVINDRFYTCAHGIDIRPRPQLPLQPFNCRDTFYRAEEALPSPIIGGLFPDLHPHWAERAERKRKREVQGLPT